MDSVTGYFDLGMSFLGLFANLLALEAVASGKFILAGYRRFIISLLASDICIYTAIILLFGLKLISESFNSITFTCLAEVGRSLEIISLTANLLSLCGMSADHFIGISYPLQYRYLSNHGLAKLSVALVWLVSFAIGFADYPFRIVTFILYGDGGPAVLAEPVRCNASVQQSYDEIKKEDLPPPNILRSFPLTTALPFGTGTTSKDDLNKFVADLIASLDYTDVSDILFETTYNSSSPNPCLNMTSLVGKLYEGDGNEAENEGAMGWCAHISPIYKVWMEVIVVSLSFVVLFFLIACYSKAFKAIENSDTSRRRIGKLMVTTITLVGTFIICWIPFVIYEVTMVFVLKSNRINFSRSSAAKHFIMHQVLHSLCITVFPFLVPVIYAARIHYVQRRFLQHLICMLPASMKQSFLDFDDASKTQVYAAEWSKCASRRHKHISRGCCSLSPGVSFGLKSGVSRSKSEAPRKLLRNNTTLTEDVSLAVTPLIEEPCYLYGSFGFPYIDDDLE